MPLTDSQFERLAAVLAGETSPGEAEVGASVREFEGEAGHVLATLERARLALRADGEEPVDTERGVAVLAAHVAQTTPQPAPRMRVVMNGYAVPRRPGIPPRWRRAMPYVTGAACLWALGMVIPRLWDHMQTSHGRAPAMQVYATERAQRADVPLPDGSRAILGPQTTLRYRVNAETDTRLVELEGQAYFTVAADAKRMFVVRTGHVTTRVLGTSFTVRAYATDHIAQIAVATGKVAVDISGHSAVLIAGDVGRLTPGQAPAVSQNATVSDVFGWTQGRFTMHKVRLQDVAYELERQYDLDVQIPDQLLAGRTITVAFSNRSATDMLDGIAMAVHAKYTRMGQTVTFMPQ